MEQEPLAVKSRHYRSPTLRSQIDRNEMTRQRVLLSRPDYSMHRSHDSPIPLRANEHVLFKLGMFPSRRLEHEKNFHEELEEIGFSAWMR
jgi:hypothetical protein